MTAARTRMAIKEEEWVPPQDGEWTIADFMRLQNPPGYRYELIEGVLHMSPSPKLPHQRALMNLLRKMDAFVNSHELGEVFVSPLDVAIDRGESETVVEPDIIFVSNERRAIASGDGVIQGAPDLLVEVLSPTSKRRDKKDKFDLYMTRDVLEYWIVDPEAGSIAVWVRRGEKFVLKGEHKRGKRATSEVLAGFSVEVSAICGPR